MRRWLSSEHYPSEVQIPKILAFLVTVEDGSHSSRTQLAPPSHQSSHSASKNTTSKEDATSEAILTQERKEIKNIERNNVKSVKRKAKKTTTSRPKISLDDTCASCPARDKKSDRFVDSEGTCENGIMFIAQCPGEVEMTSELRSPLIGLAGREFNRLLKVAYIKRDESR